MRTRSDWRGDYLDGRTAHLRPAELRLMATGIEVTVEGQTTFWPYLELRQTQGRYAGEDVRLERGGELSEAVIVRDRDFLVSLRQVAPGLGGRLYEPGQRSLRLGLTVAAGVAVIALGVAIYLWGIPLFARAVAAQVPVAWEEQLGAAVVREVAPPKGRCTDPARQQRIEAVVSRLAAALPASVPYRFRVLVDSEDAVNAMAAPGGFIVVFRGLLDRTDSAEELAGVLAHEMQHVVHRHVTRMIVQHASTGLLLAAVTGDVTGVMAYGLESARVLGALQYGRRAEEEADRDGLRMLLAAGIDPGGMIGFFEKLASKEKAAGPTLPRYLSSHPLLGERIARLKALASARPPAPPARLLADYDWTDVRRICAGAPPR